MIYLLKKLIFLNLFCFISSSLLAFNSSSFLISQSAYNNYDYAETILNFEEKPLNDFTDNLLDKLIAAVIIEDISLANRIAKEILLKDPTNQEAYIVRLAYLYVNEKFGKIIKFHKKHGNNNDLIEFIFFNDQILNSKENISKAFIDIVVSSYSSADQRQLNYNFLLFYTSVGKLISPENDRATLIKGELFQNINKDKIARKIFETITPKSEYYIEAQKSLAYNYSTFLSHNEAVAKIEELLKNTNDNYYIKKILADFYRYEKKYEISIEIYNELITEKGEDLWEIYYKRGVCYERSGEWNKAEKDFLKSLDLNPNSPNVLNYLAYGWVERGKRLTESLEMLKNAYDTNPDSFYIIDSLAWAYFKLDELEQAATLMEKVIDIAPGEAISLDHLGDIYYAMNRKREAMHFWQQALELADPEDEIEEKILSKLDKLDAGQNY